MPTSALNLHPTVLLALIRFCWKDTGQSTFDLTPTQLAGDPWCLLFLQGFFLPAAAALPKTLNEQLPNCSHSSSKLMQEQPDQPATQGYRPSSGEIRTGGYQARTGATENFQFHHLQRSKSSSRCNYSRVYLSLQGGGPITHKHFRRKWA